MGDERSLTSPGNHSPPTTQLERFRNEFSPRTIAAALASPFRAVRAAAADVVGQRLAEPEYQDAVVAMFDGSDPPAPEQLDALSTVREVKSLPIADAVAAQLRSSQLPLRKNAARLLARCFPEACPHQSPVFGNFDVRYEFCFSQDGATAVALYRWFLDNDREPDPAFGLLLTPEWIAAHAGEFPDTIGRLASQCGYSNGQPIETVIQFLQAGFWCVPDSLAPADGVVLASRSAEIERLMSQLLHGSRAPEAIPLDLRSPLDFAALCGAARAMDHELLCLRRYENPLWRNRLESCRSALCKHATMSYCRRLFASDGLQAAREFSIPAELIGKFLVERTCTLLLHDADLRMERTLHLKTRWHPKTRKSLGSMHDWAFPVQSDADDPQLKLTVLPPSAFASARRFMEAPSPAARAAANLMHAVGCSDLIPVLFEIEHRHADRLIPIGIEIQTPFTAAREHESLGWKQSLRALGIPSPRRPEYRSMVEASIPPARSFVTQQAMPLLLARAGLFAEPTDLALHMSFSGTLDRRVQYLLMAQQFINEPRIRTQRSTQISRLMSKGFLHLNVDAVPLDGVDHGGLRTELRSFRMGVEAGQEGEGPALRRQFVNDLSSVSLLVAAMRSRDASTRSLWDRFCDRLEHELATLSPRFQALLDMNWWEATGEPRDEAFARELPIVQCYLAAREWVVETGRADELREHFRELRSDFANQVARALGIDQAETDERLLSRL